MNIRSFISIELSNEIKNNLVKIQQSLKLFNNYIKWEKKENHHLTLSFLGNIDEKKITEIIPILNNSVKKISSFKIKLENIGIFPNLQNPRIFWIGISNGTKELIYLQNIIAKELENIGFEKEKKFVPHITFGRIDSKKINKIKIHKLITLTKNIDTSNIPEIEVQQVFLIKSILIAKGSIYIPLENFKLEGKNA